MFLNGALSLVTLCVTEMKNLGKETLFAKGWTQTTLWEELSSREKSYNSKKQGCGPGIS